MERLVKIIFGGDAHNSKTYEHKLITSKTPEELEKLLKDKACTDTDIVELRKNGVVIFVGYAS